MREKKYINYAEVQSVLVLFVSDRDEGNVEVGEIIREMQRDGKQVTALGNAPKCKIISAKSKIYRICGYCDKNAKEVRDMLQNEHFDMVLDLSLQSCKVIQKWLRWSQSFLKVGMSKGEDNLDMVIQLPEQTQEPILELYRQIKHYLSIISSTKE